jgi:hypothetical protein
MNCAIRKVILASTPKCGAFIPICDTFLSITLAELATSDMRYYILAEVLEYLKLRLKLHREGSEYVRGPYGQLAS